MTWGFQSWDANGVPNNFGIVPISVIGRIKMANGQQSGTYSFQTYPGYSISFIVGLVGGGYVAGRRTINVSGNNIVIGSAADNSIGGDVYPSDTSDILVFMVKT